MKPVVLFLAIFITIISSALAADPAIDFRTAKGQDAWQWLQSKNFILERSANDRTATNLKLTDKGLVMEALRPAQAIIGYKHGHVDSYRDIEIVWGVNKFPKGASYAKGRRNEAIMLYVFFGKENIDSGSVLIPDSPYFLALQLCENDPINMPQKGRFFHDGGRFMCVAHPNPGELVTTRINLKQAFKDAFGFNAPPLYGIALEFDTTNPQDDGTSSAFVQSINIPGGTYIRE